MFGELGRGRTSDFAIDATLSLPHDYSQFKTSAMLRDVGFEQWALG
jgi:hypothetical protein